MIGISPAEIHVWLASDGLDVEAGAVCERILSSDEIEQARRFHFQKDRSRYLATRVFVRRVLSRYEPFNPADWVFLKNPYGRPEIDAGKMGIRDLFFNLSHSAGLIVVAVSKGRAVGVDLEHVSRREDLLRLAQQHFAPAEHTDFGRTPIELCPDRFFQFWTLKEAYIKARGMGVSIPLARFGFRLDRCGAIDLEIAPELGDDPRRWQCWQFCPANGYIVALCAERVPHTSIIARRMVSSDLDYIFPLQFDRVSSSEL